MRTFGILMLSAIASLATAYGQAIAGLTPGIPASCPVGLHVRHHAAAGAFIPASGTTRTRSLFQIAFDLMPGKVLQQAVLVFSGTNASGMRNASLSVGTSTGLLQEKVTIKRQDEIIRLKKLAVVEDVRLVSLQYADGTQWTETEANACHVAPDASFPIL